jgi:acetyl esterase/lipase
LLIVFPLDQPPAVCRSVSAGRSTRAHTHPSNNRALLFSRPCHPPQRPSRASGFVPWPSLPVATGPRQLSGAKRTSSSVREHGCDAGAKVYAAGHDMKDPLISQVYGDMTGFPPAILTSGTRDLLLSNTVRVHRKLRQAGVKAMLPVYEGQSHAHYLRDDSAPETKEVFAEISSFFNKHMGK